MFEGGDGSGGAGGLKGSRGNMYSDVSELGDETVELDGLEREVDADDEADLLPGLFDRREVR